MSSQRGRLLLLVDTGSALNGTPNLGRRRTGRGHMTRDSPGHPSKVTTYYSTLGRRHMGYGTCGGRRPLGTRNGRKLSMILPDTTGLPIKGHDGKSKHRANRR